MNTKHYYQLSTGLILYAQEPARFVAGESIYLNRATICAPLQLEVKHFSMRKDQVVAQWVEYTEETPNS